MPELPEVHTIACGLAPRLEGRTIEGVAVFLDRSVQGDPAALHGQLAGRRIRRVWRRGKCLLLDLDPEGALAFHLKMTGRLFVAEDSAQLNGDRHGRIAFYLRGPGGLDELRFSDMRTFGYCRYLAPGELEAWPFMATLGPEPLELDSAGFAALFRARTARIKALLLDQRVIAGIGNIYADEALHRAGIRPDARADGLGAARLERLHDQVQAVLQEAIAACGSSIRDYRDANGNAGAFQNTFRVYGKAGQPCPACGRTLVAAKVAGRTSTYCPRCQRA
jgi:formamidopyrimidine-DNA glycosylase